MLRLSRLAGARFTWTRTRSRWERARRQPGRRGRSPSTQCSTRPSLNTARRIWGSSIGCFYAIAPTSQPMPAVIAIARPPQNVTRIAPIITLAPPARAASPPISARTASDDRETKGINRACGAIAVTMRGIMAPRAKLHVAARDACNGRARNFSEIPSSSRAYAPKTEARRSPMPPVRCSLLLRPGILKRFRTRNF